jgi:hypothetical protein
VAFWSKSPCIPRDKQSLLMQPSEGNLVRIFDIGDFSIEASDIIFY